MRLPTLLSLTALLLAGTVHGLDPAVAYARAIEATWAGILSKQRMLTEYTRVWEKGWGHGDLGIANEKAYGNRKIRFIYDRLVEARDSDRLPPKPVVCETGFMAGHSALIFLDALPNATFYEFDLGDLDCDPTHPHEACSSSGFATKNSKMLTEAYSPQRFVYVAGDIAKTLPAYKKKWDSTGVRCDVVFVDGRKGVHERRSDVISFQKIAKPEAMVFGDEANGVACMSGAVNSTHPACNMRFKTEHAWNSLVRHNVLKFESCSAPQLTPDGSPPTIEDNVCLWHFAPLGEAARRGGHGLGKLVDKVKSLR